MGVPERYFALRTVAKWVREAGLQLPCEDVRGQSMVVVGRLPPASLETMGLRSEMQRLTRI
jgi:hypothetical protein